MRPAEERERAQLAEHAGLIAADHPQLWSTEALRAAAARCEWCGGEALEGTTCPRSITCPTCGAGAGSPCRRPSGHRAMVLHVERIRAAEGEPAEFVGLVLR